ncbi:MAG: murein biosynthesis integral membrane protein MurJ [Spirochaetia bacterium]|nr:murein biosynthesis integral membrane protein MurJ [Spirochaetia bacterium]
MSTHKIARSAVKVSAITMLSRILGYLRDAISAAVLGVGIASDAFFVAFRIPNMLRNLLAEGALSSAFIPVFTEYLEKKTKEDVWRLAANVLSLLAVVLTIITALGVLLADPIVRIMAPGFISSPEKFALTVSLTRWLFPFILFVSIAALFMGILNSLKKFSMPAFAPVVLNVCMIASGLWLSPRFGSTPQTQVYGWVVGALVGAVLEIVIQWIPSIKEGFDFRFFIDLKEEGLRRIGRLMVPATLAQSVTQINLLVNTILASFLAGGAVTYLYYGNRLMQLPFGVFGVAIATVSFPYISSYAAKGDMKSMAETIHSSLKQAFFITIPASAGLIFLTYPINALLFNYGRFTMQDTQCTAKVSAVYCIAIFAFTGIKILTQVFYAIDKAAMAVKISTASMILNVILCVALMFPMNYTGLALATALTGIFQYWLLYHFTEENVGNLRTKELMVFGMKITAASLIMGGLVLLLSNYLQALWNVRYSRAMNAVIVAICILAGAGIYAALMNIFRVKEAAVFTEMITDRLKRRQPK